MAVASAKRAKATDTAVILLNIHDGTRGLMPTRELLLRVRDGRQKEQVSKFVRASSITLRVPFSDNLADNYTVLVSADGYRDAGSFPVKISLQHDSLVYLMLVPKRARYQFLPWPEFKEQYPKLAGFLCCAGNELEAREHYEQLITARPAVLASLLNLTAAMASIQLPSSTPLDYFKRIEWDQTLAQDRFFGFADEQLLRQVKTAASQGAFVAEPAAGLFHGDATCSYKQIQFGEANVQLTFHEHAVETIGDVRCIRVEPDIDYYKDLAAHALLEVIPNSLAHGLTDPQVVYVLRWIAGKHANVPEFDPGYMLV